MLTNVTRQMCGHPKSLANMIQELVGRVEDLEAVQGKGFKKGIGKIRRDQASKKEAADEARRKIAEEQAAVKAEEERAQTKAEAEEDALAAAEQGRLDKIKRSNDRAAAKSPPEESGNE